MAREVPLLLLLTLSAVLSVEGYSHFNEIKEKDVCTGDSVVGAVSSFPGNHVEGPASEVCGAFCSFQSIESTTICIALPFGNRLGDCMPHVSTVEITQILGRIPLFR